MARDIKLVVAGAGAFGREHLKALAAMPRVQIVGVADIDLAVAHAAADRYGAKKVDSDVMELIRGVKPDGLIVASPGKTHVQFAIGALEQGISVLVEKPIGITGAEARKLAAAEKKSRGFVLPGHVLRFSEHHRILHDISRSPEIGPILAFIARRHRDESHAARYADIDPVLMTMIHDIDLALWFTGAPAAEVYAIRRPSGLHRSSTLVSATCANNAAWQLNAAWTFPTMETPPDRIEIIGECGSLEFEADTAIHQYGAARRSIDLRARPQDPLAVELAYFVECIRNETPPKTVCLRDACAGFAIADAALASLRSGKVEQVQ